MAPVIGELEKHGPGIDSMVCVTAQHRALLDQVLRVFEIHPDLDLDLMEENQSPSSFTARAIGTLTEVLHKLKPDLVLVQGDTSTALIAGLAAFYQKTPVGHVEAGLRTCCRYSPFPEEMNRRLLASLSEYHFAPTKRAARALEQEGVAQDTIFVTGNTVIDALMWIGRQPLDASTRSLLVSLGLEGSHGRRHRSSTILLTAHRRESFGAPLERICRAVSLLVDRNPDVQVVYPVHPNPNVRELVFRVLGGHPRIHLIDPLPYHTFVHLMLRCHLILTDSGGLQEEGPAVGKPVLVLRDETERPEAVEAGNAKVVGSDLTVILEEAERLLNDADAYSRMAHAVSPYGDGHASERIVRILCDRRPAHHLELAVEP
jgi:UDP-N-acetylglucosamine 2-epimerase (non-hydrolysing)